MTIETIKNKFLNESAQRFDNTFTDVVADLETHFQGSTIVRTAIEEATAAGFNHQEAILNFFESAESNYTQTLATIGVSVTSDTPKEYDLLMYDNKYLVALYINGEWMEKCVGHRNATVFAHKDLFITAPHIFTVYRFSNA